MTRFVSIILTASAVISIGCSSAAKKTVVSPNTQIQPIWTSKKKPFRGIKDQETTYANGPCMVAIFNDGNDSVMARASATDQETRREEAQVIGFVDQELDFDVRTPPNSPPIFCELCALPAQTLPAEVRQLFGGYCGIR